jgi:AraC family ethanolamine operon transcriptional activator
MERNALRFDDAQEQACALRGWNQNYLQLSAGAYLGELAEVQGRGIRLFVERVQQSVLQSGCLPAGVLALGVPLQASGASMFCGQACDVQAVHLFSGASGFEFRTPRQHTMLVLELQWDGCGAGIAQRGSSADIAARAGALTHTRRPPAAIKAYVMALYQSARREPALLQHPAVLASVCDYLQDSLDCPDAPGSAPGHNHAHWELVRRAVAVVQNGTEGSVSVTGLCQQLGVSRRTLQNAFQRVLDMGPLAYVKALRLKQARECLKQAQSVTEAATACGFWHFGHFAHDYRALFGECPSDTLRRWN